MLDSPVDEIKSKLNVEDVISSYIQLQRAGRNLKARCPFHNEKTPSFMVSTERQFWYCFGCNEGGDIFKFVMKMEGLEFKDSLRLLADKAGVRLQRTNYSSSGKKGRSLEIIEVARKFYEECLKIKEGKKADEYLLARGLTKESIENFQLGYAPDSWDILSKFLMKKGFKESEIFDAGMMVKKDRGGYYDRFRGRIMFPVNNIIGQTIGFSSRIMPGRDESQAKYINTPDTLVYNKSNVLYGLDKAKVYLKNENLCILAEGNMDVIASFQAGVKNVVATSGTALTKEQLRIVKRYTDNIAFSFDADSAGIKASGRGIDLALGEGMNTSIIKIPEGKDPADAVKSSPELWKNAVKKPRKIMEFYFDSVFSKYDANDIEDKKKIANELLEIICRISNKIEQVHYLQILSEKINVDEKVLKEILEEKRKQKIYSAKKYSNKTEAKLHATESNQREMRLQERLLGFIVSYPKYFDDIFPKMEELFSGDKFESIYLLIKDIYKKEKNIDREKIAKLKQIFSNSSKIDDGDLKYGEADFLWNAAALRIETEFDNYEGDIGKEIEDTIVNLKKLRLQKELSKLEEDIRKAEKEGDLAAQKMLSSEFNNRISQLSNLEI